LHLRVVEHSEKDCARGRFTRVTEHSEESSARSALSERKECTSEPEEFRTQEKSARSAQHQHNVEVLRKLRRKSVKLPGGKKDVLKEQRD
jgi:hypothetical protein